jgi:hypothetical protein
MLARLPAAYTALHDLRMPGSRANIDHLVIGPTGVFTVETKHYSSDVVIRGGVARHAGRSMDTVVEQANRQAEAVRTLLGTAARALVCVQGAEVTAEGWFTKPVVDGVRFCSGRNLLRTLTRLDPELEADEVRRLVGQAEARLATGSASGPLAGERVCDCGRAMVLRRRKIDGASFWGCSQFPTCRVTRPA